MGPGLAPPCHIRTQWAGSVRSPFGERGPPPPSNSCFCRGSVGGTPPRRCGHVPPPLSDAARYDRHTSMPSAAALGGLTMLGSASDMDIPAPAAPKPPLCSLLCERKVAGDPGRAFAVSSCSAHMREDSYAGDIMLLACVPPACRQRCANDWHTAGERRRGRLGRVGGGRRGGGRGVTAAPRGGACIQTDVCPPLRLRRGGGVVRRLTAAVDPRGRCPCSLHMRPRRSGTGQDAAGEERKGRCPMGRRLEGRTLL